MKKVFLALSVLAICILMAGVAIGRKQRLEQTACLPRIEDMTLREKVGQLFYIRLEMVDPNWPIQCLNDSFMMKVKDYPCGGFLLSSFNYRDSAHVIAFNEQLHALYGHPLLCLDEEGGCVVNLASKDSLNLPRWESTWSIGRTRDVGEAYRCGRIIGHYMKHYGFDVSFAPVADVWTNPENTVIGTRAYSDKAKEVAVMCRYFLGGLNYEGILGSYKHYPGHGNTLGDTHKGAAYTDKTWEELKRCELIPFEDGIAHGLQMIMASHVSLPNVTGDSIPASISRELLTRRLRGDLGFQGVIITDSYRMRAVLQGRNAKEQAIQGIRAGVDIILSPRDYFEAFDGIVEAVEKGQISEERINASVKRALAIKQWVLTHPRTGPAHPCMN